jgi:DNA polymerase V
MYGIVDSDNCYVSCERVFRPDLDGKVVVVLSNNDGCVVARSNEAKAIGIKEGIPYFQLAEQFPNQKIAVFSSNYELYGELTSRVVSIISVVVGADV